MFYVLYLASDNISDFNQMKKLVKDITPVVASDILNGRLQISEDSNDTLKIWCEYFALRVNNGGQHVRFRSEDYGMEFKYQFWFDVYTVTQDWLEGMLSFVGKIMKTCDGDCILEANGDTSIVMRTNNVITVDDSNLRGLQRFPFQHLGFEYQEGHLKQV